MVGAGMVEIPAGRFRMGSVGFYPEEGPVREVDHSIQRSVWKVNSQKSAYSIVHREHHLKTVRLDP